MCLILLIKQPRLSGVSVCILDTGFIVAVPLAITFCDCVRIPPHACILTLWQCPEVGCLQAFKKHSQLTLHVTRHSGDLKPFKCPEEGCQAAFVWPSKLRKHQKQHRGVASGFLFWELLLRHYFGSVLKVLALLLFALLFWSKLFRFFCVLVGTV